MNLGVILNFHDGLIIWFLLCYVAVCNNYAICNKLQTALNWNAVCNTSYFKLRCDDNAICNVLQIASKFYHLKILKMKKKNWLTAKCIASIISYYEFSQTPIYSSSACKSPNHMERQINIYSNIYTYLQIFGPRYKSFIPIFKCDYLYLASNHLYLGTNDLKIGINDLYLGPNDLYLSSNATICT